MLKICIYQVAGNPINPLQIELFTSPSLVDLRHHSIFGEFQLSFPPINIWIAKF